MNWYKEAQNRQKEWDAFFNKVAPGKLSPGEQAKLEQEQIHLDTSPVGVKENQWADVVQDTETMRNYMGIGKKDQARQMRKNRGLLPSRRRNHGIWTYKHPEGKIPEKRQTPSTNDSLIDPSKLYTKLGPMPDAVNSVEIEARDIAYEAYQSGKIKSKDALTYKAWLMPILPNSKEKQNQTMLSVWEQYYDLFMSGEISKDQFTNWRSSLYKQKAAGNWYTQIKTAFPYGRIKCPHCHKSFANDFGFKDVNAGGTSTQDVQNGGLPFVDFEKKQYKEPIDGVAEDQVERGTITVDCPNCHQWLEVEYEWNTGSPKGQSPDFFSQVAITDIQQISPEMAEAYKGVGMTSGLGVPGV